MNRWLMLALPMLVCASGCIKCYRCEPLPSGVTYLQGEWEWIYTERTWWSPYTGYRSDTLYPEDVGASAVYVFTNDGCFSFTVNGEEHHACMEVYSHRIEENTSPVASCEEVVTMHLDSPSLTTNTSFRINGSNCEGMTLLKGFKVPLDKNNIYMEAPTSSAEYYTNYYKRVR